MAYFEITLTLMLGFIGLCVFAYIWNNSMSAKRHQFPPGPGGWPIVGNVLSLDLSRLHVSLTRLAKTYGETFCIHVYNQKVVVLNSIDIIEYVFVKNAELVAATAGRHKTFFAQHVYTDFQSIAFLSASPQQLRMRKLFIKALNMHADGVQANEAIIQDELQHYVLRELANQNGLAFDPDDVIYPSLINIMCVVMLGNRLEKDDPKFKAISDASTALIHLLARDVEMVLSTFPFMRHFTFFKQGRCYQEAMRTKQELLKVVVEEQKASYSSQLCRGMIDEAIRARIKIEEDGSPQWITDATLEGFAIDVFFGGTQTTRGGLLSFFLALVNFPHVVCRIQHEIDDVIGDGRMPCLKDRENMPYLNAVILEMFRTSPPSPIPIPRRTTQDLTFRNYTLPKGTMIMANIWNVHHDEGIFPNPDEFIPERFLDASSKLLPLDNTRVRSVIPFSLGRRACPGDTFAKARIFLYIATILQRFSLVSNTPCPHYDPRHFPPSFLTRPAPYMIKAIPRQ